MWVVLVDGTLVNLGQCTEILISTHYTRKEPAVLVGSSKGFDEGHRYKAIYEGSMENCQRVFDYLTHRLKASQVADLSGLKTTKE